MERERSRSWGGGEGVAEMRRPKQASKPMESNKK